MSRAPWRDALDAKIRVKRHIESGEFTMLQGGSHSGHGHISTMTMLAQSILNSAEPIWITRKIGKGLANSVCDESLSFDFDTPKIPENGFIHFQDPLTLIIDDIREGYAGKKVLVPFVHILYGRHTFDGKDKGMFVCSWIRSNMVRSLFPISFNIVEENQSIADWIIDRAIAMETPKQGMANVASAMGIDSNTFDSLESSREMYGYVLRYLRTLFLFMEQSIVTHQPTPVDRNARREAERLNMPSDVRVVSWRLARYERLEHETQQVDWSCHWSSKAHTRKLRDGRVVPVKGSIKGPRNKPYKPPTPIVHVVDR